MVLLDKTPVVRASAFLLLGALFLRDSPLSKSQCKYIQIQAVLSHFVTFSTATTPKKQRREVTEID